MLGNLAYAGLETGVRGTFNFNRDQVDAGVEALKKTIGEMGAALKDERGFIDPNAKIGGDTNAPTKPTIDTPEQLAKALNDDYKPKTGESKRINDDITTKYNLSPDLAKRLDAGEVMEDTTGA